MGTEFVIQDESAWPETYKSEVKRQLFVVTDAVRPFDLPSLQAETLNQLDATAIQGGRVKWHAHGRAELTADGEFVVRPATLDHLFLE